MECLYEALPQLILGIVFVANNYPFLKVHDAPHSLGIHVPMSLISALFSFGTVIIGIYQGAKASISYAKAEQEKSIKKMNELDFSSSV